MHKDVGLIIGPFVRRPIRVRVRVRLRLRFRVRRRFRLRLMFRLRLRVRVLGSFVRRSIMLTQGALLII